MWQNKSSDNCSHFNPNTFFNRLPNKILWTCVKLEFLNFCHFNFLLIASVYIETRGQTTNNAIWYFVSLLFVFRERSWLSTYSHFLSTSLLDLQLQYSIENVRKDSKNFLSFAVDSRSNYVTNIILQYLFKFQLRLTCDFWMNLYRTYRVEISIQIKHGNKGF